MATLVKITSWEANGYDDSDWDTIYFNVEDKSIFHDPGTTRGYTVSEVPADAKIISLENALKNGIVDEQEVRDSFAADTFKAGKVIFSLALGNYTDYVANLNLPVTYVMKAYSNNKRKGILINTQTVFNSWRGIKTEKTYGIIYDIESNKIVKTNNHNITVEQDAINKIAKNFIENAPIYTIASYVSALNSCSIYSNYWLTEIVLNFSKGLFEKPNLENASDETTKVRKPSKASYEKAQAKIKEKTEQFKNWVNTLDKTEEEKMEILKKTIKKYLTKEMNIVAIYEA